LRNDELCSRLVAVATDPDLVVDEPADEEDPLGPDRERRYPDLVLSVTKRGVAGGRRGVDGADASQKVFALSPGTPLSLGK
jgi:hypothetical protein